MRPYNMTTITQNNKITVGDFATIIHNIICINNKPSWLADNRLLGLDMAMDDKL